MKTVHYVFILGLLALVFVVEFDLSRRAEVTKKEGVKNAAVIAAAAQEKKLQAPEAKPAGPAFAEQFKSESLQIGKIQNDPEAVQNRLKLLAKKMTAEDVQSLFELISDDRNDGDQRAMAIELLSIKNDTASLMALQNFVANNMNVNGQKWDRKKELETVLRAQAVESIAAYPSKEIALSTLDYLQFKVDQPFLNDRIGRAAAHLTNFTPSLQEQDEDALKELVQ